jgi:hypothetical protein
MGQFCGNARGHQAIASAVLRLAVPEREEVGWNGSFAGIFWHEAVYIHMPAHQYN